MNISLPQQIKFNKISENRKEAIIGPCHPGYGITLGNAFKRVILSSLEGGAPFAVKIKGVQHEFSTIPNVLEDVVEIILNLKQLRLKIFTEEEVKISLDVKGEKEVKAKDIKTSSDVEIVNPDLHIATLTDKKAELKMDIFVKKGRGYWPIEDRDEKEKEIGVIALDAFFSPIKKVGLKTENVRVKQMTTYENITLDIETDGSITPEEALKQASDILVEQFTFVSENVFKKEKKDKEEKVEEKEEKTKETKKAKK